MLVASGRRAILAAAHGRSLQAAPLRLAVRNYANNSSSNKDDPLAIKIPEARGASTASETDAPSADRAEPPSISSFPPQPPFSGRKARGKAVKSGSGVAASIEERMAARNASLPGGPSLVEDPSTINRPEQQVGGASPAMDPPVSAARERPGAAAATDEPIRAAGVPPKQPGAGQTSPPTDPLSPNALAETSSSSFASQMLDLASEAPPPRDEGPTGARSKTGKRSLSSIERRRQFMSRVLMTGIAVGGAAWVWNMGREWENEKERRVLGEEEDGTRASRAKARILDMFDYFNKPAWDPLLPPPLPEPHGRPYTLLVDLDDLLINSSWTREYGWRTAKRPGVDYFLGYLSQFYEIVIFTTQPAYTAAPVCEKLDPYGYYAPYKLFRESCRSRGVWTIQLLKDLEYLGRDLSKVVWLDTKPDLFALQPDNGFAVAPWKGNRNDTGLVDLIPLLEAIVFNEVRDVRDVVRAYKGRDPIQAYAESEARQKRELVERWEKERKSHTGPRFNFGSLFGLSPSSNPDQPPQLPVEKQRQRAQQAYVEDQKYWKDNEASLKKLMEEDRERQIQEMKGSLLGFLSGQNVGPPKPPGSEPAQPSK